jgi:hypothetical protein
MSVHTLPMVDRHGATSYCKLVQSDAPPWELTFETPDMEQIRIADVDLFQCLCRLRDRLEQMGVRIACNGARIDAWASSMSRGMGGARKVYLTRMGQTATFADLVPTFGESSTDKLASVSEQAEYHKTWLESLK